MALESVISLIGVVIGKFRVIVNADNKIGFLLSGRNFFILDKISKVT